MKPLLALLLCLVPHLSRAQSVPTSVLGGTLQDCIAKYGPATKESPPATALLHVAYTFAKGGYKIHIQFLNDRVASIGYISTEPIPDADIVGLLQNHAQGSSWNPSPGDNERERRIGIFRRYDGYFRADQGAFAQYEEIGTMNELFIVTAAFHQMMNHTSTSTKDL